MGIAEFFALPFLRFEVIIPISDKLVIYWNYNEINS